MNVLSAVIFFTVLGVSHPVQEAFAKVRASKRLLSSSRFDFKLIFHECKTVASSMADKDMSIKAIDGETYSMTCSRNGKRFTCVLNFNSGKNGVHGNQQKFGLLSEIPGELRMVGGREAADYFDIRTDKRMTAMSYTRVVGDDFSGVKVCKGVYLTKELADKIEKSVEK